jgi:hypothetical protein
MIYKMKIIYKIKIKKYMILKTNNIKMIKIVKFNEQ